MTEFRVSRLSFSLSSHHSRTPLKPLNVHPPPQPSQSIITLAFSSEQPFIDLPTLCQHPLHLARSTYQNLMRNPRSRPSFLAPRLCSVSLLRSPLPSPIVHRPLVNSCLTHLFLLLSRARIYVCCRLLQPGVFSTDRFSSLVEAPSRPVDSTISSKPAPKSR